MLILTNVNEVVLLFLAGVGFFVALEVGFRLGCRHRDRSDEVDRDHVRALQAALLGLLALLLGFNFAMASSRFDTRKALMDEEVNTIGTTWLRAQLLPSPQRETISRLLKDYVTARIDFMRAGVDEKLLELANVEASNVEAQIWKVTRASVADGTGGSQIGLFIESMNNMVTIKWKRSEMLENHVPEPVLHLLLSVALGALGFIGYGYGLNGERRHGSTAVFALLIALVLATILDFDRPRGGFIQIGEEGFVRLQEVFDRDAP